MENGHKNEHETMPTISKHEQNGNKKNPDPEDLLVIPGGHRARKLIRHVPQGTIIDQQGGKMRHLDKDRKTIEEFGHVKTEQTDVPLMPGQVVKARAVSKQERVADPSLGVPTTFGTGWVTYSGWLNSTGSPISYFSTTWKVPPAPISQTSAPNDSHVIFLFNGIQNSNFILQPVLQWGYNFDGTGPFWVVASWYVDGQGGQARHSSFVRVSPGDTITGVMTRTGGSGTSHNYDCSFVGMPTTYLQVENIEELKWANETLEVYGITGASSYPPTFRTRFYGINIQTGSVKPALNWTAYNSITDCGQNCSVVTDGSLNGEVDLCYGTVALPSTALVSWADERLDALGLGTNSDLAHKYWGNYAQGWGVRDWEMLGGFLNSPPVAACWFKDRIDIFGLGKDNGCWHKYWNGSSWGGWESLGGTFTSPLAVCSWAPNRLDLFGLGMDHGCWHKWYDTTWGPSFTGWESLGGVFNSPLAVVSWAPGRLDIFGLGAENGLYHKWWDGAWGPSLKDWQYLGGTLNSPPTVVSWGPNRLDIFGLGLDNSCNHKYWDGNAWYPSVTGWYNVGGTFTSCVQAVSQYSNSIDLVGLGLDHGCWHNRYDGSNWQGWTKISSSTLHSAPSIVSWGADRVDIVALGEANQMLAKSWTYAGWSPAGLDWVNLGGIFNPD